MKKIIILSLFTTVLAGCSVNQGVNKVARDLENIQVSNTTITEKTANMLDRKDENNYGLKSMELQDEGRSLLIKDKFNNDIWIAEDPARIKVSKILPAKVFFRDLEKIPEINFYMGVYIKNYKVNERYLLDVLNNGDILYTCPEEIEGQVSVIGEYHLFVYNNDKIISDKLIPVSNNYKNENNSNNQSFSLVNTKINNLYLYDKAAINSDLNYEKIKEKYRLERTKFINFADYTGDNLPHEFIIVGFYLSCGHEERLIAGFDQEKNEVIIFPIKNDLIPNYTNNTVGRKFVYWQDNFMPNNKGAVHYTWNCGDHGSLTEIKKNYTYNQQGKYFELISESERKCE